MHGTHARKREHRLGVAAFCRVQEPALGFSFIASSIGLTREIEAGARIARVERALEQCTSSIIVAAVLMQRAEVAHR